MFRSLSLCSDHSLITTPWRSKAEPEAYSTEPEVGSPEPEVGSAEPEAGACSTRIPRG